MEKTQAQEETNHYKVLMIGNLYNLKYEDPRIDLEIACLLWVLLFSREDRLKIF